MPTHDTETLRLAEMLRVAYLGPQRHDAHQNAAALVLASDWLAARDAVVAAQAKAEALREAADAIRPGDHTCFKMWCPQCAVRKECEQRQRSLRNRADALRAVSSVPQATETGDGS